MNWEKEPNQKMHIPGLTNSKEIKKCIKMLCTRKGENKPLNINKYETIKAFPDNSNHYLIASTYNAYNMSNDGSYIRWTEFQLCHLAENKLIDSVEAKLKSNNMLHFSYHRQSNNELFYLDSSIIDWNIVEEKLKMWAIKVL